MGKNKKNSSVPHTINGWNFQVAAAIYTFLSFMKETEKVGLEKTEDAEIVLNSGKTIFVQAKSSLNPDKIESENHFETIKEALRTLEGRNSEEVERLLVLFNFFKPFGKEVTFDPYSYDKKAYSDLTTNAKKMIDDYLEEKKYVIDKDKLGFWLLKFDGENKHSKLLEYFKEKFNIDHFNNYEKVLDKWRILLYDNGSQVKRYIEKELLAGAAFNEILSDEIDEDILDNLEIDYYPGDIEEIIKPEYFSKIQKLTYRFSLCNKYTVSYLQFLKSPKCKKKGNERLYEFILDQSKEIPEDIGIFLDDINGNDEKRNVYKLFLYSICIKYRKVKQICEVMGIDS